MIVDQNPSAMEDIWMDVSTFKRTHTQSSWCRQDSVKAFQETANENEDKVERCGEPSPVEGRQHSPLPA